MRFCARLCARHLGRLTSATSCCACSRSLRKPTALSATTALLTLDGQVHASCRAAGRAPCRARRRRRRLFFKRVLLRVLVQKAQHASRAVFFERAHCARRAPAHRDERPGVLVYRQINVIATLLQSLEVQNAAAARDIDERTVLMRASVVDNPDVLCALMKCPAVQKTLSLTVGGQTALQLALEAGCLHNFDVLKSFAETSISNCKHYKHYKHYKHCVRPVPVFIGHTSERGPSGNATRM